MKTIELDKATASLAEYTRRIDKEPLIVTRQGEAIAALVPIEGADSKTAILRSHPGFLALIERSRMRHAEHGGIPADEMRRKLGHSRS